MIPDPILIERRDTNIQALTLIVIIVVIVVVSTVVVTAWCQITQTNSCTILYLATKYPSLILAVIIRATSTTEDKIHLALLPG